jgi:PAS domain S-box-containing protein
MSWVTAIWSIIASACCTLAGLHLLIWFKQRKAWGNLLFALSAVTTSFVAACELWMMRSATTAEFGTALRCLHVTAWVIVLALIGFVQLYLRAGRTWLAWTVAGARTLSLALNFVFTPNLNFREITGLKRIPFLGEAVSIAHGVSNPWMLIGQSSLLLFLIFVVDATFTIWRRGDRRPALILGGGIAVFVGLATGQSVLVFWQVVPMPITASWFYMGIVLAMGYELSRDVVRAASLADELRESERRLTLATEAAHLGLWFQDLARQEIWATDRWRALFGFAKSEPLELDKVMQRLHPDDRDKFLQAQAQALLGDDRYEIEIRVLLPDGPVRWVVSRGGVERTASGTPLRIHGVSIEITARKQAEERFRLAVEAAPNAMVMVNREGHVMLLNAQTEKVFGYAREELLGRSIELLIPEPFSSVHPGYRQSYFPGAAARAMGAGRDLHGRRKDGSKVPVEISLNPIDTPEGTAVLASIVDVTARRKIEAETAQQRNELAHLSRVTMLGELSGSLAHELNQPLTAILSNAQAALRFLAQDPGNIDEVREILEDIAADDKRAGEVIRRLRTLLRKEQVPHGPLDVNEVVLEVLKLMRSDLLNRNVAVSTELAAGLSPVAGDRVQLQQVLLNLVMNGCDAMDSAAADRLLTLRTAASAGGEVVVSVADRGRGIPSANLERIFEPFVSTKADGMGLGLAVCRTIVTAHDGRLWATNNPDRGATIHFTLPANKGTVE